MSGPEPRGDEVRSVAAERGQLAMEAISLSKDFRLGRGQILHAVRAVTWPASPACRRTRRTSRQAARSSPAVATARNAAPAST